MNTRKDEPFYVHLAESKVEPFITMKAAAAELGLPYFKLRRFVKSGAVPTYRVGNSRRLLRISELIAAIEQSREGGANG